MVGQGKEFYISIILVLTIAIVHFYLSLQIAMHPKLTEEAKYVSDEVWYVNSARNILREVFNLQPRYIDREGLVHYTLIFEDVKAAEDQLDKTAEIVRSLGGKQIYNYTKYEKKIPGIGIAIPPNIDVNLISEKLSGIKFVQSGHPYPTNVDGIHEYTNWEHPPLLKYIIGFSMLILGDNHLAWRLPSLILGSLLPIFAFLTVYYLIGGKIGCFSGVISSLAVLFDPIARNMSALALLDLPTASFIALALLLAVKKRYYLSGIAIGIATSIKFTGAFAIPFLYLAIRISENDWRKALLSSIHLPFITWLIINLPLIVHMGVVQWLGTIGGALKWHTTSRPEGPPTSYPWEWLINANPFPFSLDPKIGAVVNIPLYIIAFGSSFLAPFLMSMGGDKLGYPHMMLWSCFLGFIGVIILGNRTLYSFYAILLSPSVYASLGVFLASIISKGEPIDIINAIKWYPRNVINLFSYPKIPLEIRFLRILLPTRTEYRLIAFILISLIFYSFIEHMPNAPLTLGVPSHYSDIMDRYNKYLTKIKIPFIERPSEAPLLEEFIFYFLGSARLVFGVDLGTVIYYVFNAIILLLSALLILKDIEWILVNIEEPWWRAFFYAVTPSIIAYSIYSWDMIPAFLSIHSLRLYIEGKFKSAGIFSGLAFLASPITIFPFLAIVFEGIRKNLKTISWLLLVVLLPNIPLIIYNHEYWLGYWEKIYTHYIEGSWITIFFENYSSNYKIFISAISLIILIAISADYTKLFKFKSESHRIIVRSWLFTASAIFSTYIHKPQLSIILLPYLSIGAPIAPILIYLMDILNASVIGLWWSGSTWSKILFKYEPQSPLHRTSLPSIIATLRDFILLYLIISTLARKVFVREDNKE